MLSTSPHGNAVSFSYGAQVRLRQGLPPCWFNTLAIALGPLLRNGLRSGHGVTGLRSQPLTIPHMLQRVKDSLRSLALAVPGGTAAYRWCAAALGLPLAAMLREHRPAEVARHCLRLGRAVAADAHVVPAGIVARGGRVASATRPQPITRGARSSASVLAGSRRHTQ